MSFSILNNVPVGGRLLTSVRIGSNLALPNYAAEIGYNMGAADFVDIADQNGAGCLAIRGFSRLTLSRPFLITEVQFTTNDVTQQSAAVRLLQIQPDGTVVPVTIDVAATAAKDDTRLNLFVYKGQILLTDMQCIEFNSVRGVLDMTIRLKIEAWGAVRQMVKF
jgi:hypothetical protein